MSTETYREMQDQSKSPKDPAADPTKKPSEDPTQNPRDPMDDPTGPNYKQKV